MPWIIDTDLLIEGERGNRRFLDWLANVDSVATADVVRGEFLIGVHSVGDEGLRARGMEFYSDRISKLSSLPCEPSDFAKGAMLAGEARRGGRGSPSLIDGLIAAIAIRTGATVATRNTTDFAAMGCPCANPL